MTDMIVVHFRQSEVIADLHHLWEESQHTETHMNEEIPMTPLIGWLQHLHQWLGVHPLLWNVDLNHLDMVEEKIVLEIFMDADQSVKIWAVLMVAAICMVAE